MPSRSPLAGPFLARSAGFVPGVVPAAAPAGASAQAGGAPLWFAFRKGELLVDASGQHVPRALALPARKTLYVGTLSGVPCFAADLDDAAEPPAGTQLAGMRTLYMMLDRGELEVALTASPLVTFERTHRFCGACGARTEDVTGERSKRCPACGETFYPRVTPAAIVLVHDGPRVLLARSKQLPKSVPWYALVAGFVETGETFEECAAREVKEETGVLVDEVTYQGSQPWPFPHQIMVGFRARYAGGEVVIDENELSDARWFDRASMPPLPPPISIARALIDAWVAEGDT